MMQPVTIKDTRANLAELIDQVYIANKQFLITKFGKPKAMLVPVNADAILSTKGISSGFGAWAGRKDIKDPNNWVRKVRKQLSKRT